MEFSKKNPFDTIKANDLNDDEIIAQWVNLPNNRYFELFSPTSSDAKLIIGGKGSGKTHLMRYFSYQAQKIRNIDNPLQGIVNDGYLGIYFQASGLHGSRFDDLPFEEPKKLSIFSYYLELWLTSQLLEAIKTINNSPIELFNDEKKLCHEILDIFDEKPDDCNADSLEEVQKIIKSLIKNVDLDINNYHFISEFKARITVTRGNFIFGIPKLLSEHSKYLKDTNFLYLADELENISTYQQKYFNTIIRERKQPITFRIGARRNGIKTFDTLGSGEPNKKDNEFQLVSLDNEFTHEDQYSSFATELIINRLVAAELAPRELLANPDNQDQITKRKNYLQSLFEKADIEDIITKKSKDKKTTPTLKSFQSRLKKALDEKTSEAICNTLSFNKNPIVEKAAIHLLCQKWNEKNNSSEADLLKAAKEIKEEIKKYINDQENLISSKINYFQNNYISSALRHASQNNLDSYSGFNNLLIITKGYPRHILTVLRHIYKIEAFTDKKPFSPERPISVRSQRLAMKESCDWFHDDCITEGELGNNIAIFLNRLCSIFRLEYYADKPVECSASSFTLKKSNLPQDLQSTLDWALMMRVIIQAPDLRQGKNDQETEEKFYLNSLLCPRWGLPIQKRGALSLSTQEAIALLDINSEDSYDDFRKSFSKSRYAPFQVIKNDDNAPEQQGLVF